MDRFGNQPYPPPTTPPVAQQTTNLAAVQPPTPKATKTRSVVALFVGLWLALVGGGIVGASAVIALPQIISQVSGNSSSTGTQGNGSTDTGSSGQSQDRTGSQDTSNSDTSDSGTTREQTKSTLEAPSAGVVLISATTTSGVAAGTGMVLTADGQVLTNYHVVAGSSSVEVTIADTGETYTATVVGSDPTKDVALLSLKNASGLKTVTVDDDTLATGDSVVAFGNANGGGELVAAAGKVTGLNKSLQVSSDSPWGATEDLSGMIQTNAGAVPGDSGGPMYDDEGEVTGMTTAGSEQAGISYAVPINTALKIVDQVRSGDESGTVQVGPAGYLGITSNNTITSQAGGLLITSVSESSPAAEAGIVAGDSLLTFGGTTLTGRTDAASIIRSSEPGEKVKVSWIQKSTGETKTATVTLGTSPLN